MTDWTEETAEFRTILTVVPIRDDDVVEPLTDIDEVLQRAFRAQQERIWREFLFPPGTPEYDELGRRIVGRGRGRRVERPALPPPQAPAGD